MFPKVIMNFRLIIFFAFFATISCETFQDEISKIYVNQCKGKIEDLAALELKICKFSIDMDVDKSAERIRCMVVKDVISDICNGTNENVKFIDIVNAMKESTNATNFCEKRSPIQVNNKVPASVANFMQILSNSRKCEQLCADLTDRTFPICSFSVSYFDHKSQTDVLLPVVVNHAKNESQPVSKSGTQSAAAVVQPSPLQNANGNEIPNGKVIPKQEKITDPRLNQTPDEHQTPNQRTNIDLNLDKTKDFKSPLTELKKENPVDKNEENVPDDNSVVSPTLSKSLDEAGEVVNNPPDVEQEEKEPDDDNQPIIIDDTKKDTKLPTDTNKNTKPTSVEKISDSTRDTFVESEDSHFFYYFIFISALCIFFYVAMYNKKKILALMIEGRRSNVKRRPNSAAYCKLDCNLEEAMTSGPSTSSSNTLLY